MCKIGFHNFSDVQSDFRSDICVELQKPIGTRDKCKSWITLKFSDDVAFRKNGTENAPCSPRLLFLLQGIRKEQSSTGFAMLRVATTKTKGKLFTG